MPLLPGERYLTPPTEFPPFVPPPVDPLARALSHVTLGSNNLYMPFNAYSSGSSQQTCYRVRRVAPADRDLYGIQLGYANVSIQASGETLPADTYSVRASVVVNDVVYPAFFDGQRSGTVEPGALRLSDKIGVFIPRGTVYWIHNMPAVDTLGKKWPVSNNLSTALGEGYSNSVDFLDTPNPTGLAQAGAFHPTLILGQTAGPKTHVYALIGSSSAYGQGDTAEAPNYDYGYLSRLMTNKIPHVKLTRASDTIQQFLAANKFRLQIMAAAGVTHVLFQSGSNDVSNGASFAQMQDRLSTVWSMFHGVGIKVIQSTITQSCSSTDGFTTVAGQTPTGNPTVREQVNEWIRTERESGKLGVIDPARITAAPGDPLRWRVDGAVWTPDGTHLTQHGHRQVAAALSIYDLLK